MKNKDVVIIGGGLAGTCIANSLVETMNVTVIEKGPDNGYTVPSKVFVNKTFGQIDTYVQGVGGTTHLWHNGLMELESNKVTGQFQRIIEEVKVYLNEAANSLGLIGEFDKHKKSELDYYNEIYKELDEHRKVELDTILVPKTSPLKKLHKDVKIYSDSQVESYNIDGDRVESIKINQLGNRIEIPCHFFIISGGGIGSVSIVSDLLDRNGLESHHVGKGLIDHPMGFLGKIKLKKNQHKLFKKLFHHDTANYSSRCGIVVNQKNLNHIFYFRPAMSMDNRLSLYKFKSKLGVSSWSERLKLIFKLKFYHPDILIEIISHLFGYTFPTRYFAILAVFEQESTFDRSVTSSSDNIEQIDWSISDEELASYSDSLMQLKEILNPLADKINLTASNIDEYLWSAAHHSSTISFGEKEWELDANLKLNSFNNVFVCDGSVIEKNAYVNTGLLIAQLALRLCNHISTKES
jgi:hypothetical protein